MVQWLAGDPVARRNKQVLAATRRLEVSMACRQSTRCPTTRGLRIGSRTCDAMVGCYNDKMATMQIGR